MTLSGNLGFVPLDEILRLLTRSKQQGAVEVTANGLQGRVFVGKSGIDLATTSDDDVLHRHLVNSGYADESVLRRITTGETTLAALAESNKEIVDLLREMTVESVYQISDHGGDFKVIEGQVTPYASPNSFELESLLSDAEERSRDWAKVSEIIPELSASIGLRRDLGDREEVSVRSDDWKILSEIGNGKSVREIADDLGTTEFWTARVVARLVNNELVELSETQAGDDWQASDAVPARPTEDRYDGQTHEDSYRDQSDPTPVQRIEPSETDEPSEVFAQESPDSREDDPHNESWWQEPKEESDPVDEEPKEPEVVSEGLSEIPPVQAIEDSGEFEDSEDVEEDTEAFLEKVFSELDSDKSESDEGHGLLRRRRMGTLRDFSSDS